MYIVCTYFILFGAVTGDICRESAQLISTPRERREVIRLAEIRYREIIILETSYI